MDAYGTSDAYATRDTPQFLTVEGQYRLNQFGIPASLTCVNQNPELTTSPYNQRFGITLGSIDDRRDAVLGAMPCQSVYTDGKVNWHGDGGSFLNIGGAGQEYRRRMTPLNAKEKKEKYTVSDGSIQLSNMEMLFILLVILAIVLSMYAVKQVNNMSSILTAAGLRKSVSPAST